MDGYRFDKLKILVADDSATMRKLVITILQAFGTMQIAEATDGERAWARLSDFNPDVLLLDWMMNGMSGIDLVKAIRTSPQSPNPFVPVIMLTGRTHIDDVREARDAGVNEFLVKPVSVKGILSRLTAVIENPRPFVRAGDYFGPCRRRRNQEYQGTERRSGAVAFPAATVASGSGARLAAS